MVEAPRIRILCERIQYTVGKTITYASGPSYTKFNFCLINFKIKMWWFAGKYIYVLLQKKSKKYVIRTHMMMYGKIVVNKSTQTNPKLTIFMSLKLDDNTTLDWYLSQIKLLDPTCKSDNLKSNYTTCSSAILIRDSFTMVTFDISAKFYNNKSHLLHIQKGLKKFKNEIITDFLLDQEYFPGVGNILQQEVLYSCLILPTKLVSDLVKSIPKSFLCLTVELVNLSNQLYNSYTAVSPTKSIFKIYHKKMCILGHKTITKYIGYHERKTTWCPICQT